MLICVCMSWFKLLLHKNYSEMRRYYKFTCNLDFKRTTTFIFKYHQHEHLDDLTLFPILTNISGKYYFGYYNKFRNMANQKPQWLFQYNYRNVIPPLLSFKIMPFKTVIAFLLCFFITVSTLHNLFTA